MSALVELIVPPASAGAVADFLAENKVAFIEFSGGFFAPGLALAGAEAVEGRQKMTLFRLYCDDYAGLIGDLKAHFPLGGWDYFVIVPTASGRIGG
ncbi:MAG: hypothetical protein AB7E49_00290 [Campylobacterales bacterium]